MPSLAGRVLLASAVSAGVVAAAAAIPAVAYAGPGAAALAGDHQGARDVIVMLRNQHTDLSITKGGRSPRVDAVQRDEAPVMATAQRSGVHNVHGFKTVNAFSGQATPAQIAALSADPAVQAVYPDLPITRKPAGTGPAAAGPKAAPNAAAPNAAPPAGVCPTDPAKPLLEPEALQTTNTAFSTRPRRRRSRSPPAPGVKVAWLADGIDINNPDFIRPDGSHVFVDYQDFSGEGPNAPERRRRGVR